jgi:hypothetical protein
MGLFFFATSLLKRRKVVINRMFNAPSKRVSKTDFLKAKNKHDLIKVFDKVTEYVQEIHLCPEFQPNLEFLRFLKSKTKIS